MSRKPLADAIAVFTLIFTFYLLTFNGRFTSIDELAIYARTESVVQQGNLDRPQIAFASYHNPVGEQEAGFSLVASPLYWLAQQFGRFNNIHVVMLLNPLLTASTAVIIFGTTRTIGYSRNGSIVAALAFGLTTLAWPYARTLYREPLVGFGWSLGLLGIVLWRYKGCVKGVMVGGIALVLTLTVKVTAIAGLPFIFLAITACMRDRKQLRRLAIISLVVGLGLTLLFYIVFMWRFDSTSSLATLWGQSPFTTLQRTYGQLLSPGKGIVFYMPVVILAAPGLLLMARQHRSVALAAGLPLLTSVLAYSNYASWFGGQSWGPRFLVPSIPLLMLGLAPLWDEARRDWQRAALFAVLGASLVVQLGVVTADWWPGYRPLFETGPAPEDNAGLQLGNIALSPPLVQLRVWDPGNLDLLWLHPDAAGNLAFSPVLALLLSAAVIAAIVFWWLVSRRAWPAALLLVPAATAVVALLGWGPRAVVGYPGLAADQGRALATYVAGDDNAPYTLVTVSNEFHIYYYLGFLEGDFIHHWISPRQAQDFNPILQQTVGDRLTLAMDRVHLAPEYSGKDLERWLNDNLFRTSSHWIDGYELVNYAMLPTAGWQWQEIAYTFGDSFSLTGYALSDDNLYTGETLGLKLRICRVGPLPDFHQLFNHLQASESQISGHDGPIGYGYGSQPVESWEKGDCLVERRAITIPANAQSGTYDLIVGFKTANGLLGVSGSEANGAPGDYATVGQVNVISPDPGP